MRSSKWFVLAVVAVLQLSDAWAAHVDMNDPRRALGREDDVRVDAQLAAETVSSGSPVGVTYQIENLSSESVAVADKVCDVTYDVDSRTITVAVGSEVPNAGTMPRLIIIASGEKKTFTAGAMLHVSTPSVRSPFTVVPRFVQIKVNFLRNLAPFRALIARQARSSGSIALTDAQFEQWLLSNATVLCNAIPVQYSGSSRSGMADASQRH